MWEVIMQWIAGQASGMWAAIGAAIPPPPPLVTGACAGLASAVAWIQPVSWIVPVEAVAAAIGLVLLGWTIGLAVVIVRIVVSFVTLGGGGT